MRAYASPIGFTFILPKTTVWLFGLEIFGKLFLTSFRIVAVGTVIRLVPVQVHKAWNETGFIVCVSLILTGALGNIIDSVFYGCCLMKAPIRKLA